MAYKHYPCTILSVTFCEFTFIHRLEKCFRTSLSFHHFLLRAPPTMNSFTCRVSGVLWRAKILCERLHEEHSTWFVSLLNLFLYLYSQILISPRAFELRSGHLGTILTSESYWVLGKCNVMINFSTLSGFVLNR